MNVNLYGKNTGKKCNFSLFALAALGLPSLCPCSKKGFGNQGEKEDFFVKVEIAVES